MSSPDNKHCCYGCAHWHYNNRDNNRLIIQVAAIVSSRVFKIRLDDNLLIQLKIGCSVDLNEDEDDDDDDGRLHLNAGVTMLCWKRVVDVGGGVLCVTVETRHSTLLFQRAR